jgi:hypothetical protein
MTTVSSGDEVEDLPGALDLDPGRPRLIGCGPGRLSLGMYQGYWQIQSGASWVQIGPSATSYRNTFYFLVLLGILIPLAGEYVGWRYIAVGDDRVLFAIAMPLPGIALLIGAGVVRWWGRSDAAKGPIFRYSGDDRQFQLLRINRTIPRSQMVRLDLISGTWIRNLDSPGESQFDGVSELHLVVRLKSDKLVSLPLLGTQGTVLLKLCGIVHVAKVLSDVSGIPLQRISEDTSFFDPYPQIKDRLAHGLCPKCGFDLGGKPSARCPQCGADIAAEAADVISKRPAASSPIRRRRRPPRIIAAVAFTLLALLGDAICIPSLIRQIRAGTYPTVQGTIVDSRINSDDKPDRSWPTIRFAYVVAGRRYESEHYDYLIPYHGSLDYARSFVARFPKGRTATVHFNPHNPADAVLSADVLHGEGGITLAILIPLNLIAAGLWPFAIRRYV